MLSGERDREAKSVGVAASLPEGTAGIQDSSPPASLRVGMTANLNLMLFSS